MVPTLLPPPRLLRPRCLRKAACPGAAAALVTLVAMSLVGCGPSAEGQDFQEVEQHQRALVGEWTSQDIGSPNTAGSWSLAGGTHTVQGAGADIWNSADEFHFAYQDFTGDVTVTARVASLENQNKWTKAAVMIREELTAGSRYVATVVSPTSSNRFRQQVRSTTGGGSSSVKSAASSSIPSWIRLERVGSTFRSYHSSNGTSWTLFATKSVSMNAMVHVGLAVTSHVETTLATGVFTDVGFITPAPPSPPPAPGNLSATPGDGAVSLTWSAASGASSYNVKWATQSGGPYATISGIGSTSYTHPGLTNGTTYYYVVSALNAGGEGANSSEVSATPAAPPVSPWTGGDIGAVAANGSHSESSGTFTVNGSGADIWSTADEFHFVRQSLTGDGTITARVVSLENTNSFAKAGVMMRESLTAGSRNLFALLTPTDANGFRYQSRTATGDITNRSYVTPGLPPGWVRIVRAGNVFTGQYSTNGTTWNDIGPSVTLALPATIYVGLAVTSHADGVLATGVFDNVSLTTPTPTPPPAPSGLAASPGDGQVALSWNAATGATSYTVKRSLTAGGPYDDVQSGLGGTNFTDSGLVNGTTYYYVVSASNAVGQSGNSNEASATPVEGGVVAVSPECQRWQSEALTRVSPATAGELDTALAEAQPGTMIELRADTTYVANGTPQRFRILNRNGTSSQKIFLCGPRSAVLKGTILSEAADDGGMSTNYGLWLNDSSYWVIDGFTVRTSNKGVILDGSHHNLVRYLHVHELGEEGIHVRRSSTNNTVEYNLVEDTGHRVPGFGEGIYVGTAAGNWLKVMGTLTADKSDNNTIRFNTTLTTSEGVDIKEGTRGGTIEGNTIYGTYLAGSSQVSADSCMELKGTSYLIKSNHCETTLADGLQVKNQSGTCTNAGTSCPDSGSFNVLELNSTNMATPTGGTATGYSIRVNSNAANNTVRCNNTLTNKASGYMTNVTCVP